MRPERTRMSERRILSLEEAVRVFRAWMHSRADERRKQEEARDEHDEDRVLLGLSDE